MFSVCMPPRSPFVLDTHILSGTPGTTLRPVAEAMQSRHRTCFDTQLHGKLLSVNSGKVQSGTPFGDFSEGTTG
jgi:hypothetical protein